MGASSFISVHMSKVWLTLLSMAALQYLTLLRNIYGHTNVHLYTVIIYLFINMWDEGGGLDRMLKQDH